MPAFFVLSALLFPAVPLFVSRSDPVPVPDPVFAPASAPALLRNACGGSYFRFVVREMLDLLDCLPRNACSGSYFCFKYRKVPNLQESLRRNVHSGLDVRFVFRILLKIPVPFP